MVWSHYDRKVLLTLNYSNFIKKEYVWIKLSFTISNYRCVWLCESSIDLVDCWGPFVVIAMVKMKGSFFKNSFMPLPWSHGAEEYRYLVCCDCLADCWVYFRLNIAKRRENWSRTAVEGFKWGFENVSKKCLTGLTFFGVRVVQGLKRWLRLQIFW
jgi:hypothetical protein